jgi:hypothetical protein
MRERLENALNETPRPLPLLEQMPATH